ncbi:MAG: hypothetical protein ACE5ER_00085 [Nitrospinaceae bacterium]
MADATPLHILLEHFKWHVQRLAEMNRQGSTLYFRDAALQRFEFTFESALKCIQAAAESPGGGGRTPEETLELALEKGWWPGHADGPGMLAALDHLRPENREDFAAGVYQKLPEYQHCFEDLLKNLAALT